VKTVLILLIDGFEELEAIAPIDVLRRAGAQLTIASMDSTQLKVKGRNGVFLLCENTFEQARKERFDLTILPGGPGHQQMKKDPQLHHYLREIHHEKRWIAAICAAPTILLEAGIIDTDTPCTGHDSIIGQLPQIQTDRSVILHENILTARGAGAALEFGLCCVELLFGKTIAHEIKEAIHSI
jgi:4-methyl-5(b-hydroxyethyl)-thiazole monophosphate biosynthesis